VGTNYPEICRRICELDESVIGAWVIDFTAQLVGRYEISSNPVPNLEREKVMLVQTVMMVGMMQKHEDMYGKVKKITVTYDHIESLLLPLLDDYILAIGCVKPCDIAKIIPQVEKMIRRE